MATENQSNNFVKSAWICPRCNKQAFDESGPSGNCPGDPTRGIGTANDHSWENQGISVPGIPAGKWVVGNWTIGSVTMSIPALSS